MGFFNNLLLAGDSSETYETINDQTLNFVNSYIIPSLMTVLAVVAAVFLVVNVIRIIKSSAEEERAKAKKNLIWCVAGVVVAIAGIWLIPYIIKLASQSFSTGAITAYNS